MTKRSANILIKRHGVRSGLHNPFSQTVAGSSVRLTEFQARLITDEAPVRIAAAPTGAGKTFAFELAPVVGLNVLFVVPTRRLAQNLETSVRTIMQNNGWDETEIKRRLAVWTSDAMDAAVASGSTPAEVRRDRVRQLRGLGGFRAEGTFIIATPESVGQLLLNPPRRESGQAAMSLGELLSRNHIVFDEFHLIEARGFGLAAAICRVSCGLSKEVQRPKVTFLSATPIEIASVLKAFEVPEHEIAIFEEYVESWRFGEEPSDARIIHGDVHVSIGHHAEITEACYAEEETIARTLAEGQTVVVIFDSVATLKAVRGEISDLFQCHGVSPECILVINSIDDIHERFLDAHSAGGRSVDPRSARVLLATSSIEIGVTFKSSLMIMDPGHNAASFIQRVGRVSRGDLPGRVVVAGHGISPFLRPLIKQSPDSRETSAAYGIEISAFTSTVLQGIAREFSRGADRFAGTELHTYSTMPHCAVWCACLFWCALREVWCIYAGERATLRGFRPSRAAAFEAKIARLRNSRLERPREWLRAFILEATRFRDIEPRVRVRHGNRTDMVPESMACRFKEVSSAPLFEDDNGPYIQLQRPFESILKTSDTRPFQSTIQPLAPLEGMTLPSLSRRFAASEFVSAMKLSTNHFFGEEGDRVCSEVMNLVRMTGVVPFESDNDFGAAHQGSVVM